jgi:hypothetical protein
MSDFGQVYQHFSGEIFSSWWNSSIFSGIGIPRTVDDFYYSAQVDPVHNVILLGSGRLSEQQISSPVMYPLIIAFMGTTLAFLTSIVVPVARGTAGLHLVSRQY